MMDGFLVVAGGMHILSLQLEPHRMLVGGL
jgi:hypothetical protein